MQSKHYNELIGIILKKRGIKEISITEEDYVEMRTSGDIAKIEEVGTDLIVTLSNTNQGGTH